jgi:hypothetical protein
MTVFCLFLKDEQSKKQGRMPTTDTCGMTNKRTSNDKATADPLRSPAGMTTRKARAAKVESGKIFYNLGLGDAH